MTPQHLDPQLLFGDRDVMPVTRRFRRRRRQTIAQRIAHLEVAVDRIRAAQDDYPALCRGREELAGAVRLIGYVTRELEDAA